MKVINFFDTDNKEHWIGEIERSDWRAGAFLGRLLRSGEFFDAVGEDSRVLLLTEGDELISYCTFAEKDDIQPTDLTPWVGFVYTFPEHRGHRYAGLLFNEVVRLAKDRSVGEVYLSTNHGYDGRHGRRTIESIRKKDSTVAWLYIGRTT